MMLDNLSKVTSSHSLLDISHRLERQAILNYDRLASKMRQHHNLNTAMVFERLADEERSHENALLKIKEDTTEVSSGEQLWSFPAEMELDDIGLYSDPGDPFLLSPYDALCYAIYNENMMFDLFTHLASVTNDNSVRQLAEDFAKEELTHIAALRLARLDISSDLKETRARLGWWTNADAILEISDLNFVLAKIDQSSAKIYCEAAIQLKQLTDDKNSKFFDELTKSITSNDPPQSSTHNNAFSNLEGTNRTSSSIILIALKYTDHAVDFTTYVAENSKDEEVYAKALETTEIYTERLKSIRERLL